MNFLSLVTGKANALARKHIFTFSENESYKSLAIIFVFGILYFDDWKHALMLYLSQWLLQKNKVQQRSDFHLMVLLG